MPENVSMSSERIITDLQHEIYRRKRLLDSEWRQNKLLHKTIAKRKRNLAFLKAIRMDLESEFRQIESDGL